MVEPATVSSRARRAPHDGGDDEREFWERRFDVPDPRDTPPRFAPPRQAPGVASRRDRRPPAAQGLVERMRDRLTDWSGDTRVGIAALVVVAVVAGFVWYRMGAGGAVAHGAAGPTRAVATTAVTDGASAPPSTGAATAKALGTQKGGAAGLAVHVAGAVVHPGVIELATGSRVIDAVEQVGGALPDADLDRLNLAAKLSDGERVYVAKAGQADPGAVGNDPAAGDSGVGDGVPGAKVNLNTASQAQLEQLPGVGPTYAQAIIAERQRRGGFTSVNELRSVRGIGDKRFAELAPLVTV